jgi:putative two-component system response regulator
MATAEEAAASRKTILYIDDDRLLLTLCCDVLEDHGYRTIIATDGPSGIETAKAARPDLILLDVMMPDMDGYEVCRRLRADPALRETPIILLTAMQGLHLDAKGREAGATLTMRKDFGSTGIISTLQQVLRLKPRRPKR